MFRGLFRRYVLLFFDDILIYSASIIDHITHLRMVLSLLREHHLYANRKKSCFRRQELEYLGHIISGNGVAIDPAKVKVLKEWPDPKNAKELRGFLSLTDTIGVLFLTTTR